MRSQPCEERLERERDGKTETERENSVAFGFPKQAACGFGVCVCVCARVCVLFSFLPSGREARPPLDHKRTRRRGRQSKPVQGHRGSVRTRARRQEGKEGRVEVRGCLGREREAVGGSGAAVVFGAIINSRLDRAWPNRALQLRRLCRQAWPLLASGGCKRHRDRWWTGPAPGL